MVADALGRDMCHGIYNPPDYLVTLVPVRVQQWYAAMISEWYSVRWHIYHSILFQQFYIVTSNQVRRILSTRNSPIFSHFGETITGAHSIRAYERQEDFIKQCDDYIDKMQAAKYQSKIIDR